MTESIPIRFRPFCSRTKARQSGNIFAILFGAVAMTGILAVVGMQQVTGPISTLTKSTQKNRVDSEMMTAAKILISSVATQANSSDCDADGFVEPEQWRATSGLKPTNGGLLPNTVGATTVDPWGTEYGYCVWDHATVNHAGCGGGTQRRLRGPTPGLDAQPVMAVIAAGPDKAFQTTCRAWVDANADSQPDQPMVEKTVGSDDYIIKLTYGEAAGTGAGLWDTKIGATTTAEIQKNLEVKDSGGATMVNVDSATGTGDFMGLTTDAITAKTGGYFNVTGNLKIGSGAPTEALDIDGNLRIAHSINSASDSVRFHTDRAVGGGYEYVTFYSGPTRQAIVIYDGNWDGCSSATTVCLRAEQGNSLELMSNNHVFLTPAASGNVGIGTDAPASKLHIKSATNGLRLETDTGSTNRIDAYNASILQYQIGALDNNEDFTIRNVATNGDIHFDTENLQRMTVLNSGQVGINTVAPQELLDVDGDMVLRGGSMYFSHDAAANANNDYVRYLNTSDLIMPGVGGVLLMMADTNRNAASIGSANGGYVARGMFVSGRMGIRTQTPTDPVDVNGDVKVIKLKVTSDARLKTDIRPLRAAVDGIDLVKQIMPVRYHWKDKELSQKEQIGLLAQDLEKILPEAVGGTADHKAINYIELLPILIETLQEQQAILKDRSATIDAQIAEIDQLKQNLGHKPMNGYDQ